MNNGYDGLGGDEERGRVNDLTRCEVNEARAGRQRQGDQEKLCVEPLTTAARGARVKSLLAAHMVGFRHCHSSRTAPDSTCTCKTKQRTLWLPSSEWVAMQVGGYNNVVYNARRWGHGARRKHEQKRQNPTPQSRATPVHHTNKVRNRALGQRSQIVRKCALL